MGKYDIKDKVIIKNKPDRIYYVTSIYYRFVTTTSSNQCIHYINVTTNITTKGHDYSLPPECIRHATEMEVLLYG